MCDFAQKKMDKKREQLRAIANLLLVVAFLGIITCFMAPDDVIGYVGIVFIAVGFLGAITFDTLAEITLKEDLLAREKNVKWISKDLDALRGVTYTFESYVKDHGCSLKEFVSMYDTLGWNIQKVYEHYVYCAGSDIVQTKSQVLHIINIERWKEDETA